MMKRTSLLSIFSILTAPLLRGPLCGEEKDSEPTFDELLQLNAQSLFGGEAQFEKDRVTVRFKKSGQFERGFQGSGMVSPAGVKGDVNRKILENPAGGGEIPEIAVVGRGDGDWVSRFELSGDVEINFKIRIPTFQRGCQLVLRVNQTKKSHIQTSFFQNVMLMVSGQAKKKAMAPKDFQLPPEKWFDRKAVVPISITCRGGKFLLKMGDKENEKEKKDKPKELEMLSLDDAGDAAGGRIAFSFRKLNFVISEMGLSGNFDRAWCEAELKQLEKDKKLVRKAEKAPEAPPPQPPRKTPKKEGDDGAARKKEAEEDL